MSVDLPSLDVVVPFYNEEDELAGCLDCLVADTAVARIILVDNSSTDSSFAIAHDYAQQHPQITLIKEPAQGVRFARDTGIAQTTADIVARIDADTRVQPGWAGAIREYYATHPAVGAASGSYEFYDLPFRRFSNFIIWLFLIMSNRVVAGNHSLYGANMSIRKQVWDEVYDDIISEDGIMEDLSIAIAIDKHQYRVGYIEKALGYVSGRRMRTSPASFRTYNDQWWKTYEVYGFRTKARVTRMIAAIGNVGQYFAGLLLRFHDPVTNKFHWSRSRTSYDERTIP